MPSFRRAHVLSCLTLFFIIISAVPGVAQGGETAQHSGEVNLVVPPLTGATFLNGLSGPTLLKIGDAAVWIEAGELPPDIEPWTGSVYVYVADVDATCARAVALGARVIAQPEDKPYAERQCGFTDAGGNTWWVSTYLGDNG